MKVVLVGGGRTGLNVTKRLLKLNHEVTIVEIDEDRAQKLSQEVDANIIQGNGSDQKTLEKAGAKEADSIAILTADDDANLLSCKIAKKMEIPQIVVRANNKEYLSFFEDLGADVIISSISETIGLVEKAITGPDLYGIIGVGGGIADVIEVTVKEGSDAVGKKIQDLKLPELCSISIIIRGEELVPARGKTEFEVDDRVIVAGKAEDVVKVGRMLRGEPLKTDK